MNIINFIFQDWKANATDAKGRCVMLHYRVANLLRRNKLLKYLCFIYFLYNKIFIQWFLGVEIGNSAVIGKNCRIFHGVGIVIHPHAVIGDDCILRHGVTIGNKINNRGEETLCPQIGNNVEFGAYSAAIGDIEIGDNVIIGAGAIVVKSVPKNTVVVSSPNRYFAKQEINE